MNVRPARPEYAPAMARVLNAVIAVGGTTAHERPKTDAEVRSAYIDGPEALICHVAEIAGQVVGFQAVGIWPGLPQGWGDIGTFVAPGQQARGTGQALFAATRVVARLQGLVALNATIRSDNRAGLAFYARAGFVDYAEDPGWALEDGRVVGRVSRRFEL